MNRTVVYWFVTGTGTKSKTPLLGSSVRFPPPTNSGVFIYPKGRQNVAKRGKGTSNVSGKSTFDKFHVIEFSDRARAEFTVWSKSADLDFSSVVIKLCESGWKVSLSFSEHYDCYFGSLTCKQPGEDYFEHTFAVRHVDFNKLIGLLQYVVESLLADSKFRIPSRSDTANW